MRGIEPSLTPELQKHVAGGPIAKALAYPVANYRSLVQHVARLAYLNKDYLLFYRGQAEDYLNKASSSSFYPSIYREDQLARREVSYRFEVLEHAARQLRDLFTTRKVQGHADVSRKRYIQWSILQHYSVCATPLLDFTQSLRVACSFAQRDDGGTDGYVYVFALPYITNRISINSEHDVVNIRLLSICPPDALRPYFQEGYVAGTPDVAADYDAKNELDFNNRLVAKFVIKNSNRFWGAGLSKVSDSELYPKDDTIESLCGEIRTTVTSELHPGAIGEFMAEWADLEQDLLQRARMQQPRVLSLREALQLLVKGRGLDEETAYVLDQLRKFRNQLVHEPRRVDRSTIEPQLDVLRSLRSALRG